MNSPKPITPEIVNVTPCTPLIDTNDERTQVYKTMRVKHPFDPRKINAIDETEWLASMQTHSQAQETDIEQQQPPESASKKRQSKLAGANVSYRINAFLG